MRALYIFAYVFVPVTVPVYARRSSIAVPCCTQFSGLVDLFSPVCCHVTRSYVTAAVFKLGRDFSTLSSQTSLNKDRQCCESWKKAELRVRAVCAVGDMTDEDRWVDLPCCSPHCDTAESCLTNATLTTFSSSSDCYDDWCRPSAACPMMPAVRSIGVVYYTVVTMHLLLSACC